MYVRQKLKHFNKLNVPYFLLVSSAIGIIALSELTNIDLQLADNYFNSQKQVFIWKNSWFSQQLMHIYVKNMSISIALLILLFVAIDAFRNVTFLDHYLRLRLRFVAVAAILIPLIIATLKQLSALHCPWDLQRYGGSTPYFRLFDTMPPNIQAGHCFPAGHASTGLWLAAFCVFWLPHRPRFASAIYMAGISIGFFLGWVQQMRGAHFLTHTLTSVWVTSAILLIMLRACRPFLHYHNTN